MANTLTNLIPTMVKAADTVSRELTGLIPSVFLNADASRAAKNQTIYYPASPSKTAADWTPAATGPDPAGETVANASMSITKVRYCSFHRDGEEELGLGPQIYERLLQDDFAQCMRTLANEMEADLAALYQYAGGAYGTAGTTPFGTAGNFTDASSVRKELVDRGAPQSDLQLVIDTAAGAKIRGMQAASNTQGTDSLLRQGILLDIHGMKIRESAQIKTHTAGTASSATTNNAGYSVGDTTITLASAGTGTLLAGDVLVHARDTRKYVLYSGDTDVSNGGTFVLNAPGLMSAITAATSALTVSATHACNMAFDRNAIHLLARLPAMPSGGDSARDRTVVVDPRSGIAFDVAVYAQMGRVTYTVGAAWGVKMVKPAHVAILLG